MRSIIVIAHDMRSTHNVGSLLRTCEGLGINKVYLSGYTPYPAVPGDERLPHISAKLTEQINKTALGAIHSQAWEQTSDLEELITQLKANGYKVAALEQAQNSVKLTEFTPPDKLVILLGREVEGVSPEIIKLCDLALEIPMFGAKESFNVVQAAAMALFYCRFA